MKTGRLSATNLHKSRRNECLSWSIGLCVLMALPMAANAKESEPQEQAPPQLGWLADQGSNTACATIGAHVYFGSSMSLIDCDQNGRPIGAQQDFGPGVGVNRMAADARNLFVLDAAGALQCFDPATRTWVSRRGPAQGPQRRGECLGMAAREGQVFLAYAADPVFDNAGTADVLDFERCLPAPPANDRTLARLLRMEGVPPGGDGVNPTNDQPQGNGRLFLESQPLGNAKVAVIAFKQPVPLGSIVFPWPQGEGKVQLAALKPNAPYPPRPDQNDDWIPFESSGGRGWNCVPAPPRLMTRAVRVLFEPKDTSSFWRLEGLRLLDRRFASLFPSARVRVNSGKVTPTGEWDAERTAAVGPDKPGIYVMDWKEPQKTCGLAIKEIDGATAEIDVWQGAVNGDVPLDGETLDKNSRKPGWRNVAAYTQKRRFSAYGNEMNRFACYMDGYVDFRETIETRAIRIRITGQWLDNGADSRCRRHDGRYEHGTHPMQVYCLWLDTRVCKIMGVAPLSPLGDDPLSDPLAFGRLEIADVGNGKPVKQLPLRAGGDGISFAPDGKLYAIGPDQKDICRVDLDSGKLTSVIRDTLPATFAIGPDGLFYVASSNGGVGVSPILVYDAQGKKVREIGKAGGVRPGIWDPQRFGTVKQMCVDQAGSLWVVESQDRPRRIVQYKTDGTFVKELLGNTRYGGGGTLDRTNPSRAFYKGMEFEIDVKKHSDLLQARPSRLRAWFGDRDRVGDDVVGGDLIMRSCNKRLYLTTAPGGVTERQSVGVVCLYNEKERTVRLAAAIGDAGCFPLLRRSDILSLLPSGNVPSLYQFVWSDLNGNGKIDTDEIDFRYKLVSDGRRVAVRVGPFDEGLGCRGNRVYYRVADFLPNGVPIYKRTPDQS